MKIKQLLTKTLLVAAGLLVGTNAWGDSQTVTLTESALATLYPNNEIVSYFDFVSMAKSWNDAAEGDKAAYAVTQGDATYKVNKIQLYQVSNPASMNILSVQSVGTSNAFSWRWDTSKTKYGLWNWGNARILSFAVTKGQIVVMEGGYTATATGSCAAGYAANSGYNTFTATEDGNIAFSTAGANVRALAILNPSASAVSYTVKYVDELGTEIKDATEGTGEEGASITVTASEKASFKNVGETKKYIYKSDDSEGKTIAGDGSTIVTITFREAATYSYTVNAMNGETKLEELATGSAFELDNVTVPFHKYYNIDGTLYTKDAISSEYRQVVTLDEDDKVVGFAYTASDKTNVVFFKEAEDIATLTATSGSGTTSRCSFAQGGYASSDAVVTTLTPGKYVLTGAGYAGNLVFKAGANEVLNMETVGYWRETSSDEFVITENTDITFKGGTSDGSQSLDYVIIRKTGEVATIGATGWTTFASAYPLNLTTLTASLGTAIAYYASAASGSTVTMTSTTATVPAGEGLALKGTAGATVTIPVAAVSGTAIDGNKLVGCTTSTVLAKNENYYVLVNNGGAEFQRLDKNGATIPAGKAYLDLTGVSLTPAPTLSIVFENETSGIDEVRNQKEVVKGAYFNLAGQRVAQPTKGLYIVNGRKVVIK